MNTYNATTLFILDMETNEWIHYVLVLYCTHIRYAWFVVNP